MKKKRRHNTLEIERKLAEAEALAADGRTQNEIAQELGISVMTIHRWRKAQPQLRSRTTVVPAQVHPAETADFSKNPGHKLGSKNSSWKIPVCEN